jgi:uncharacterized protein YajQ (UPF0234 family)
MASESSFDIVSKVEIPEVMNSIDQAMKEIRQRFDFKGSKSSIDLDQEKNEITLVSDDEFKLKSVIDILEGKFVKRKVSLKMMDYGKMEDAASSTVRQVITIQDGISTERAKELVKYIKTLKLKVQAEIQKDQLRIKSKKRDDLQDVMAAIKEKKLDYHVDFVNYR